MPALAPTEVFGVGPGQQEVVQVGGRRDVVAFVFGGIHDIREIELAQVAHALGRACLRPRPAERRQEQGRQHTDNADDDQEFNECEAPVLFMLRVVSHQVP